MIEEGIKLLIRAMDLLQILQDPLYQARCAYFLSIAYLWNGMYDDALKWGVFAAQEYKSLGQYTGDVKRHVAQVEFAKGDYTASLETLVQSLESCMSYGRPVDIAETLEMMGRAWAKLGKKADAQSAYDKAMRYFSTTQPQLGGRGTMRCQMYIRMLGDPTSEPTDDEREALDGYFHDF
ncbi:hypothetical protein D9615_007535 [Tricholomella constricta]|uniref:Tetratricopeptide repeat protein n=1 Tax=Tricholomella constricta TaxID=117010 RepID=A0A8H5H7T5_9AGAR|nr:hypothetical protein D9615_007535 [Tricholomella constricta]